MRGRLLAAVILTAAAGVGRADEPPGIEALIRQLGDEDASRRENAEAALEDAEEEARGPVERALAAFPVDGDPEVRSRLERLKARLDVSVAIRKFAKAWGTRSFVLNRGGQTAAVWTTTARIEDHELVLEWWISLAEHPDWRLEMRLSADDRMRFVSRVDRIHGKTNTRRSDPAADPENLVPGDFAMWARVAVSGMTANETLDLAMLEVGVGRDHIRISDEPIRLHITCTEQKEGLRTFEVRRARGTSSEEENESVERIRIDSDGVLLGLEDVSEGGLATPATAEEAATARAGLSGGR